MSKKYDAIIIGGGHNGLVNAAYLAKAGKEVLVLEKRHVLGGAAVSKIYILDLRIRFAVMWLVYFALISLES